MGEVGQKEQTSVIRLISPGGCNVWHDDYSQNIIFYISKIIRE